MIFRLGICHTEADLLDEKLIREDKDHIEVYRRQDHAAFVEWQEQPILLPDPVVKFVVLILTL